MARPPYRTLARPAVLAALLVATILFPPAAPFAAASGPASITPAASAAPAVVFGGVNYWQGFVDFWTGALRKQNGVVLFALGVGAVSLFIITRGKWKK